jgi:hypothetical protein
MKKTDIIQHLLARAAYEDTLGPTSEGAILREAAACLLSGDRLSSLQLFETHVTKGLLSFDH